MNKRKRLTLALILLAYLIFVWVACVWLLQGSLQLAVGLVLSACGLTVLVVYALVSRLTARTGEPARTAPPAAPARDSMPFKTVVADANERLASSPTLAHQRLKTTVTNLPLFLLIGPGGAGKTSTFVHSGLEPHLLSGQVFQDGAVAATPVCNVWFANGAIVAEPSGQVFSDPGGQFSQVVAAFRPQSRQSIFSALFAGRARPQNLRGVVLCCDSGQFVGIPDAGRLAALVHGIQAQLRAIGEVFGADFPVYVLFTKADAIPYFRDYFGRVTEAEAQQPLGCSLPVATAAERAGTAVYAEAESRRITAAFNDLYYGLTRRRLAFLARETDAERKPGIYEFPRELKRIRAGLVQFLVDICRPNPLQPGPLLRGFYFTGTREIMTAPGGALRRGDQSTTGAAEATRLLRADELRWEGQGASRETGPIRSRARWTFVSELFAERVLASREAPLPQYGSRRLELLRSLAWGALAAMAFGWLALSAWSWWNNRSLLAEVEEAAVGLREMPAGPQGATAAGIEDLDRLRARLVELAQHEESVPWRIGFGLYQGGRLVQPAREAYFSRFRQVLLNDTANAIAASLAAVPVTPDDSHPYQGAYDRLKTYLAIAGGTCTAERPLVRRVLTETWSGLRNPGGIPLDKAQAQFDFYAAELERKRVPFTLPMSREAVERARAYLNAFGGEERVLRALSDEVNRTVRAARLADYAPNYAQVLTAAPEVQGAFTRDGWEALDRRLHNVNTAALGEACVLGGGLQQAAGLLEGAGLETRLRDLYIRRYIEQWKAFLGAAALLPYRNAADSAQKLALLDAGDSPLLGLLLLVRDNTQFAEAPSAIAQVAKSAAPRLIDRFLPRAGRAGQAARDVGAAKLIPSGQGFTAADINRAFQPVNSLFSKGASRSRWVDESNQPYVLAISGLRKAMTALGEAGGRSTDPALNADTGRAMQGGLDAVTQMSYRFERSPMAVDEDVARLLRAPFEAARGHYEADPGKAEAKKLNGGFQAVCARLAPLLRKYPFNAASDEDARLDELAAVFSPQTGALWSFYNQSLASAIVKQGGRWVARVDTPAGQKIAPGFLDAFNRLSAITDALFAGGSAEPRMQYRLNVQTPPGTKGIGLTAGGDSASQGPHAFNWPGAPSDVALLVRAGEAEVPCASYSGPWSLFRMMGDADPLPGASHTLTLACFSGGRRGQRRPVTVAGKPVVVTIEVQKYPGDVERAFDRSFFSGLRCPARVGVER